MPATMPTPEAPSHYYDRVGRPVYEIDCKTRDGMRRTTIRDAIELDLVPSVTTVLGVIAKPGLEAWKQGQAILAALTEPMADGEPVDDYVARIIEQARATAKDAADLGTAVHRGVEIYHRTGEKPEDADPRVGPILDSYVIWAREHIASTWSREQSFVCEDGYGGRVDMGVTLTSGDEFLVDIKTKSTKPNQKTSAYPEWQMQLAAYFAGLGLQPHIGCANLVLSTTEPGRIEFLRLKWDDFERAYKAFQAAYELWTLTCCKAGYDPRKAVSSE